MDEVEKLSQLFSEFSFTKPTPLMRKKGTTTMVSEMEEEEEDWRAIKRELAKKKELAKNKELAKKQEPCEKRVQTLSFGASSEPIYTAAVPTTEGGIYLILYEEKSDAFVFKLGMSEDIKQRLESYEGYHLEVNVALVFYSPLYKELEAFLHEKLSNIPNTVRKKKKEIFLVPKAQVASIHAMVTLVAQEIKNFFEQGDLVEQLLENMEAHGFSALRAQLELENKQNKFFKMRILPIYFFFAVSDLSLPKGLLCQDKEVNEYLKLLNLYYAKPFQFLNPTQLITFQAMNKHMIQYAEEDLAKILKMQNKWLKKSTLMTIQKIKNKNILFKTANFFQFEQYLEAATQRYRSYIATSFPAQQ